MAPSQVADYVGKDAAEKLLNDPLEHSETGRRQWRSIGGVDVRVGGDWAKALYDRAIPNFLNKYAKKWGAKVGETGILSTPDVSRQPYVTNENDGHWVEAAGHREGPFKRLKAKHGRHWRNYGTR